MVKTKVLARNVFAPTLQLLASIYAQHVPRILHLNWKYTIQVNFMKNLSKERCLQAMVICESVNLSYLIWMKSSPSRPNLSKQRLDQKSKESDAPKRLYTPDFWPPSHRRWLANPKKLQAIRHALTKIIRISLSLSRNNTKESSETLWAHQLVKLIVNRHFTIDKF